MSEPKSASSDLKRTGPRLIAIVGPFQSGKTTLLEAILARAGAITRQGSVRDGTSVGDSSPEARAHAMSVEANIATAEYLGDRFTFIDCPGSIEFAHEMSNVSSRLRCRNRRLRSGCEKDAGAPDDPARDRGHRPAAHPLPQQDRHRDDAAARYARAAPAGLAHTAVACARSRSGTTGSRRASSISRSSALSSTASMRPRASSSCRKASCRPRRRRAISMLERLADYDDALMEELICDIEPPRDKIFDDLIANCVEGLLVPVLIGSAERGNGITRLLKALRHEVPASTATPPAPRHRRRKVRRSPIRSARIHTAHGGKLSLAARAARQLCRRDDRDGVERGRRAHCRPVAADGATR